MWVTGQCNQPCIKPTERRQRGNSNATRACEGALGPYAACVSSEGYQTDPAQAGHMDTTSVILAGRRMSESYRHLVSGQALAMPHASSCDDTCRPAPGQRGNRVLMLAHAS